MENGDNILDDDDSDSEINELENQKIEIEVLLEAIFMKYGYDFRNYSRSYIKRRIMYRLSASGLNSILEVLHKALYDTCFFNQLLLDFSINVTEMFRDPSFYLALRKEVVPVLKEFPVLKVWLAGCSSGEEVYSIAILLHEEGLNSRTQIYATDYNNVVIQKAKQGIYSIKNIKKYTANYHKSGGKKSFSDYYSSNSESVILNNFLKKNVVFADHNLVTDWVFGEMNLIVCRNVMIYFNKELQDHVFKLFFESLGEKGFLGLGAKETIQHSSSSGCFKTMSVKNRLYQKNFL